MKVFAFIFARGGSKGLARKNIRELNGIPLIGYSINLAKSMDEISKFKSGISFDHLFGSLRFSLIYPA